MSKKKHIKTPLWEYVKEIEESYKIMQNKNVDLLLKCKKLRKENKELKHKLKSLTEEALNDPTDQISHESEKVTPSEMKNPNPFHPFFEVRQKRTGTISDFQGYPTFMQSLDAELADAFPQEINIFEKNVKMEVSADLTVKLNKYLKSIDTEQLYHAIMDCNPFIERHIIRDFTLLSTSGYISPMQTPYLADAEKLQNARPYEERWDKGIHTDFPNLSILLADTANESIHASACGFIRSVINPIRNYVDISNSRCSRPHPTLYAWAMAVYFYQAKNMSSVFFKEILTDVTDVALGNHLHQITDFGKALEEYYNETGDESFAKNMSLMLNHLINIDYRLYSRVTHELGKHPLYISHETKNIYSIYTVDPELTSDMKVMNEYQEFIIHSGNETLKDDSDQSLFLPSTSIFRKIYTMDKNGYHFQSMRGDIKDSDLIADINFYVEAFDNQLQDSPIAECVKKYELSIGEFLMRLMDNNDTTISGTPLDKMRMKDIICRNIKVHPLICIGELELDVN